LGRIKQAGHNDDGTRRAKIIYNIVAGKGKADYHEPNLPVISAGGNWPGSGIDHRPPISSAANLER
jgi:hypothetical protein